MRKISLLALVAAFICCLQANATKVYWDNSNANWEEVWVHLWGNTVVDQQITEKETIDGHELYVVDTDNTGIIFLPSNGNWENATVNLTVTEGAVYGLPNLKTDAETTDPIATITDGKWIPTRPENMYITGSKYDWNPAGGKMVKSDDGKTFTLEHKTFAAGEEFKFTGGSWESFNLGGTEKFSASDNKSYALKFGKKSNNIVIAAPYEDVTVTLTFNDTFTECTLLISGEVVINYPEKLYLFGQVNNKGWDADNYVESTGTENGIYLFENVLLGNAHPNESTPAEAYFSFASGFGANASDWSALNPRYGATSGGFEITLDAPMTIQAGENSFKAPGDKVYTMTVSLKDNTLTMVEVQRPAKPEVKADKKGENDDFVNFAFALIDGCSIWYKYVTDAPAAAPAAETNADGYTLYEGGKLKMYGNTTLEAYTVDNATGLKSDVLTMTYAAVVATDVISITTEEGEARYFNLQGAEVSEPANGVFIRVQNGKAVKVAR